MGMYSLFSGILEYPGHPIDDSLEQLSGELAVECREASRHLHEFRAAIEGLSLKKLQETYTDAFDMRPEGTTNLSYHMFGEDARRGVFMAEMKGRMQDLDMSLGVELPDHISLILQYMDRAPDEERAPLIEDCLMPSLKKMDEVLSGCGNPYRYLIETLEQFLKVQNPVAAPELASAGESRLG